MGQVKSRNKPKHAETAPLGAETSRPPYRGGVVRLFGWVSVAAYFSVWSNKTRKVERVAPGRRTGDLPAWRAARESLLMNTTKRNPI